MMPLQSDFTIPAAPFDRKNIDPQTLAFNDKLIKIWADGPRWYDVRLHRPFHKSHPSYPPPTY
jgi:hypothetical protein